MQIAVTPQGVEHYAPIPPVSILGNVQIAVTPQGVEHPTLALVGPGANSVQIAVTPQGVEHADWGQSAPHLDRSVQIAVTPQGVEHDLPDYYREPCVTGADRSDAARR